MTETLNRHQMEDYPAGDLLEVEVLDKPGHGGACHKYAIRIMGKSVPDHDTSRPGTIINFQNGPINEDGIGVNGLTHEVLLAILIHRLESFQAGDYACEENQVALNGCNQALEALKGRTQARIDRGVEGTHTV